MVIDMEQQINNSLLTLQNQLNNSNILDLEIFDTGTKLRKELFYETEQFKPLAKNFLQFLQLGSRSQTIVLGPRGSGKTSIVKYTLDEISKLKTYDFETKYINCRGLDTTNKILKNLYKDVKRISTPEFLDLLKQELATGKKQILILDEIDILSDDLLLYEVSRNQEFKNLHLVLITKTPRFFSELSEDVKSSLVKELFFFDSYDYQQINEILLKRAKAGLKEFDETIISAIAASNASKASGDLRIGINVLKKIFEDATYPKTIINKQGKPRISQEFKTRLDKLLEEEYSILKEGAIRSLNNEKLAVLYFVIKNNRSNQAFADLQSTSFVSMSKPHFLKLARELSYMDLISHMKTRVKRSSIIEYEERLGEKNIRLVEELAIATQILINE